MEKQEEKFKTEIKNDLEIDIDNKYYMALACSKGGFLKPVDPSHWLLVETKLREMLTQKQPATANNRIPHFTRAGVYKGFVVINCYDNFTRDNLLNCVGKMHSLIAGIKLTLIRAARINSIVEGTNHKMKYVKNSFKYTGNKGKTCVVQYNLKIEKTTIKNSPAVREQTTSVNSQSEQFTSITPGNAEIEDCSNNLVVKETVIDIPLKLGSLQLECLKILNIITRGSRRNEQKRANIKKRNFSLESESFPSTLGNNASQFPHCSQQGYSEINYLAELPTTSQRHTERHCLQSAEKLNDSKNECPTNSYNFARQYQANSTRILNRTLEILNGNNQRQPEMETITLSDDNEVEEETLGKNINPDEGEYYKAVDYLKKICISKMNLFSDMEKLQTEKCLRKIEEYNKNRNLFVKETTTKRSIRSSTNDSSSPKRCRLVKQQTNLITKTEKTGFGECDNSCLTIQNEMKPSTSQKGGHGPGRNNTALHIAVVDRNNKDLKISQKRWLQIEKQLLEYLSQQVARTGNTNIGMFGGMYGQYEIKTIQCGNEESLNFIKRFIVYQNLVWADMQLDVVPVTELPLRSVIKVSIPSPAIDNTSVLKILKAQNDKDCKGDWILINCCESLNRKNRDFFVSIPHSAVDRLKLKNSEFCYGINTVKVIVVNESQY